MDRTLFVNEIFASVQGEGFWTGTPAYFIRLSGCNRSCDFCDTFHEDGIEMNFDDIMNRIPPQFKHIIITGGEPTIQDNLIEFIKEFDLYANKIHIETNGTNPNVLKNIQSVHNTWVTISPKEDLSWGTYAWANEIKFVVGTKGDLLYPYEVWEYLNDTIGRVPSVYLQPMSRTKYATDLCYEACMEYPNKFNLSLQTHKLIGVQ